MHLTFISLNAQIFKSPKISSSWAVSLSSCSTGPRISLAISFTNSFEPFAVIFTLVQIFSVSLSIISKSTRFLWLVCRNGFNELGILNRPEIRLLAPSASVVEWSIVGAEKRPMARIFFCRSCLRGCTRSLPESMFSIVKVKENVETEPLKMKNYVKSLY